MLMLYLWLQAETQGVTHFGAYHRPPDGHFFIFVFLCWSYSWRLGPHIGGCRLLWPLHNGQYDSPVTVCVNAVHWCFFNLWWFFVMQRYPDKKSVRATTFPQCLNAAHFWQILWPTRVQVRVWAQRRIWNACWGLWLRKRIGAVPSPHKNTKYWNRKNEIQKYKQ